MLKPQREDPKTESGELSLPDQEKAEALGALGINHRRGGCHQAEHRDKSMQTSPNFRKAWAVTQVAGHLCSGRIHFLHMEEAARRAREPPLRAGGGDTDIAGRGTKQQEGEDPGPGRAHHETMRSGSPAGESSVRESGKGAGQGDLLGKGQKGMGGKGASQSSQMESTS